MKHATYFVIADGGTNHPWLYGIYKTEDEAYDHLNDANEIANNCYVCGEQVTSLMGVDFSKINIDD